MNKKINHLRNRYKGALIYLGKAHRLIRGYNTSYQVKEIKPYTVRNAWLTVGDSLRSAMKEFDQWLQ